MGLPGFNYAVVDANALTSKPMISAAFAEYERTGCTLVLPWVHVFEQTKGTDEWFHRVHNGLRQNPKAVAFAMPSLILWQRERRLRRSLKKDEILDAKQTTGLREYLGDAHAAPPADIPVVRRIAQEVFRRWHPDGWIKELVDNVIVADADAKRIRRGLQNDDRAPLRSWIVDACSKPKLVPHFERFDVRGPEQRLLLRRPTFLALLLVGSLYLALRVRMQPPNAGQIVRADWADNHGADLEAVLVALFGRRLITEDAVARETDEDLRAVARAIWT